MDAKLTLKLDESVIERAKAYARERQRSLSSLVEDYFRFLTSQGEESGLHDISPTVLELSGIIEPEDVGERRERYTDYLVEKYD